MRTQEEVYAKYQQLCAAKSNPEVKMWIDTIKELSDNMTVQYMNEKGEEAVRAWGVIKGLGMAIHLDDIYKASLPKSQIQQVPTILKA